MEGVICGAWVREPGNRKLWMIVQFPVARLSAQKLTFAGFLIKHESSVPDEMLKEHRTGELSGTKDNPHQKGH